MIWSFKYFPLVSIDTWTCFTGVFFQNSTCLMEIFWEWCESISQKKVFSFPKIILCYNSFTSWRWYLQPILPVDYFAQSLFIFWDRFLFSAKKRKVVVCHKDGHKDVYVLPRILTINTRLRVFQYKVLNNAL